jgi:HlyD family secretion protein
LIEKKRIENMFADNTANKRQLHEIYGKVKLLKEQKRSIRTQNAPSTNKAK